MAKSLKELQIGDKVYQYFYKDGGTNLEYTVVRVTATQLILSNGIRISKKTGRALGAFSGIYFTEPK